jgi:hypothetical protein
MRGRVLSAPVPWTDSRLALGFGTLWLVGACGSPAAPSRAASPAKVIVSEASELAVAPAKVRILVAGDVMPHRPMLGPPERLREALEPLRGLFAGADLTVANYESATGEPPPLPSSSAGERAFLRTSATLPSGHDLSLVAPPEWMTAAAGYFGALTVANNHACDLGRRGLEGTIEAARAAHVIALGGDEKAPWEPRVLVEKGGRRVCAVAWTTFVNSEARACPASGKLALAAQSPLGMRAVKRAVAAARASGCDATVAIFHGGTEYDTQGSSVLGEAHAAADAGADAVVIHHPHVPLPVDVYETKDGRSVPIFASVGNLVSNQGESYRPALPTVSPEHYVSLDGWTRLGVVADLEWSWPSGDHERPSLAYGYHLVWTENEHATNRAEPMPRISVRILDPSADEPLVERLSTDAGGPLRLFRDACWLERGATRCPVAPASPRTVSREGASFAERSPLTRRPRTR